MTFFLSISRQQNASWIDRRGVSKKSFEQVRTTNESRKRRRDGKKSRASALGRINDARAFIHDERVNGKKVWVFFLPRSLSFRLLYAESARNNNEACLQSTCTLGMQSWLSVGRVTVDCVVRTTCWILLDKEIRIVHNKSQFWNAI